MKNITFIFILFVSLLNTNCTNKSTSLQQSFNFHLLAEPHDLDPVHFRGSSASYLFNNLFRGLYSHSENGLTLENVKSCSWVKPTLLSCTLKNKKWSDGSPINASNYVDNFKRIFGSNSKSSQTEHLLNIKNAVEILAGQKNTSKLGVYAKNNNQILFDLNKPDANFKNVLASAAFGPINKNNSYKIENSSQLITNGPYKIRSWTKGQFTLLEPNKHYDSHWQKRPLVKIYFLENDETALTLYETGQLNFLRRLSTSHINRFKKTNQLILKPVLRFDYIGLKGEFLKSKALRAALASSLNFPELKKIYQAKGTPGCAGLPVDFQESIHCFTYDLAKAKQFFKQVPPELKTKTWTLYFSKMGGKDIKKGMEWVQNQWSKNLGLKIKLESVEQGMYLPKLKNSNINLFRKGVGVDHPSCLSALRTFSPESSENYIKYNNQSYQQVLAKLSNPHLTAENQKHFCSEGLKILLSSHQWIPLGEIHFAMLDDKKFYGYSLNKLNQLDLSGLRSK